MNKCKTTDTSSLLYQDLFFSGFYRFTIEYMYNKALKMHTYIYIYPDKKHPN